MRSRITRTATQIGRVTICMALLVLAQWLAQPYIGDEASGFMFFLGPLFATYIAGWVYGLTVTVLGILLNLTLFSEAWASTGAMPSMFYRQVALLLEGVLATYLMERQRRYSIEARAGSARERLALDRLIRIKDLLTTSERRAQKFVHENFSAIMTSDHNGRFTDVNDAFLNLTGYTREEVIAGGLRWYDVTPPEWVEDSLHANQELLRTGRAQPFEKEYFRKDGTRVPVLVSAVVIEEDPWTVATFILDLSETKRIHAAVDASEKRFGQLMEAIPQLVFLISNDASETFLNSHWEKYLGYRPTLEHLRNWEWVHPNDRDLAMGAWVACVDRDKPFDIEYRVLRADGEYRWHLTRAVPTTNTWGRPAWLGVSMDIHDQKMYAEDMRIREEELRKAKDAAEAANRAKNQFIANISHELRTPLSAILGFSELMRQSSRTASEENRDFLERISRNTEVLARLIDEILDLAKVEAQKLETERQSFSIRKLITEVEEVARLKAQGKDLAIATRWMTSVPPRLISDPLRLRQILTNMVGNAVKFTEQGRVEVHIFAYELSDEDFRWRLRIDVVDTGIGITDDERRRLFQPFAQGNHSSTERFGGTGLGLALSRRLARALGGDLILAESEPGKGSRFILTIDAGSREEVQTPIELERRDNPELPRVSLRGMRVLAVDDSADNRLLVERFLSALGAQVTTAESGRQAISKAFAGPIDAVLMDIQMPYMDGYEALRQLRKHGYTGPIIALTAHATQGERDRALLGGFTDYLSKPISRTSLVTGLLHHTRAPDIKAIKARPLAPADSQGVPSTPNAQAEN